MSDENNENVAKRGLKRLLSIFGVQGSEVTSNMPDITDDENQYIFAGTFSETELQKLPGSKADGKPNTSIRDLGSHFDHTSSNIRNKMSQARSYKTMTPEIKKARSIYIPSIMSPNDIQTGHISVSVSIPELSEDANQKLTNFLNIYFNDDLKLGDKIPDWIGDALFETGASPVLILPKGAIKLLSETTDLEKHYQEMGKELEIGQEGMKGKTIELYSSVSTELFPDTDPSTEVLDLKTLIKQFDNPDTTKLEHYNEVQVALEHFLSNIDQKDNQPKISQEAFVNTSIKGVHSIINKNKDGFTFSRDYRAIIDPKDKIKKVNKKLEDDIKQSLFGDKDNKLFVMSNEEEVAEDDHPSIMELPTESVIPVTVPGARKDHIGYFIVVDEFGNPINSGSEEEQSCDNNGSGVIQSGAKSVFASQFGGQLTDAQRYEAASLVFGITVRKMLENKLNNNGVTGITLDQHQAITNTLFQRLMNKQKVRVVFVPSNMIAYYAFEFREDGTGKSLLEDASFILALRNTLMISNVMAGIKNSTDYKKIEFDVGDQATNLEQIMAMVQDMYINKKMLRFDHNPMTTTRDLIQRSISIVPKGIKGLGSLDVISDNQSTGVVEPDSNTLETLTDQIITFLGVPYAALNELGESEFSRSVATTNLFFSNEIRSKQKITCEVTEKLVKQYTQSSASLMGKIADLVTESSADKPKTEVDSVKALLIKIINNIKVTLPPPSISVDKAHFAELREAVDIMDTMVEKLFSDEMVTAEDSRARDMLSAIRANIKQKILRDVLIRMGSHHTIDIPTLTDIDPSEVIDLNQVLLNLRAGIKQMEEIAAKDDEDIY